jgi:transposase
MRENHQVRNGSGAEVSVPRRFDARYKLAILAEIQAATEKGQVGRILRREGSYSSLISEWRKQRDRGALAGLQGQARGPKVDRVAQENQRLRTQLAKLTERLETAEELIEAQENAFALLQTMSCKSDDTK